MNLIVYYSRKGENYFNGSIKSISKGNTEIVAEYIQKAVGGDLFEIETVHEYSKDYNECTKEAMAELKTNARPEIKGYVEDMSQYDDIYVGYPNWWGTCPMCIFTFLDAYDLSGKTIHPFCTNEGSGMGNSEKDLKKHYPSAHIVSGLAVHGSEAVNSEEKVKGWVK